MSDTPEKPRRQWVSVVCWIMAGFFLVWAIIRIGGLETGFPLVQLIAFTPYALLLSLLSLLVVVLCRRWLAAGFLLLAFLALALAVLPREIGGVEEVSDGQSVRILSINLKAGKADKKQIVELARSRDIDLVVVQELTKRAASELEESGFRADYPYRLVSLTDGPQGGGIYSRWRLRDAGLLDTRTRQPVADIEVPASIPVSLVSVHPMAPIGRVLTSEWKNDFAQLPPAGSRDLPLILAGDFNATLDHAKLRDLISTGYRDAAEVTGNGLVTTWPSRLRWPPPVTIDHILAEKGIAFSQYDVEKIKGSDHRAVIAELLLPPVPET